MTQLSNNECEACKLGVPPVSDEERQQLQTQVPDWDIIQEDNIDRLRKVFPCKDFVEAINFSNQVGEIAEAAGHHPAILTEWGKVTVTWWTHKIKGLHRNDFIMAAKTDQLTAQS